MEQVLIKSKVGPVELEHRPAITTEFGIEYKTPLKFEFSLQNDCRCLMPVEVWELLRDKHFDRKANLRYKEAFQEL